MTLSDLRNIYNHCGYYTAASAIERDEVMSPGEVEALFEELERLHTAQKSTEPWEGLSPSHTQEQRR